MIRLVPSTAARSSRASIPTETADVCSRNPTTTRRPLVGGSRSASSASNDDVYRVGISSLENSARMTSRIGIGGHHSDDAEARRELGGDRRLPHAGGPSDQHDERDIERLDLPPAEVVLRIALARHVLDHRDGDPVELLGGDRRDPSSRRRSSMASATW